MRKAPSPNYGPVLIAAADTFTLKPIYPNWYNLPEWVSDTIIPDTQGILPLNCYIYIDSLYYGRTASKVNIVREFHLFHESEIMPLGDTFGIKCFHTKGIEYGRPIHYFKWDFLMRAGTRDWEKITTFSFANVSVDNRSMASLNSFSSLCKGIPYKVTWQYVLKEL